MPARKAFGPTKLELLEAVAQGWKTRRIFRLKDTLSKVELVKDHSEIQLKEIVNEGIFNEKMLMESRRNSVNTLRNFYKAMDYQGQWLLKVKERSMSPQRVSVANKPNDGPRYGNNEKYMENSRVSMFDQLSDQKKPRVSPMRLTRHSIGCKPMMACQRGSMIAHQKSHQNSPDNQDQFKNMYNLKNQKPNQHPKMKFTEASPEDKKRLNQRKSYIPDVRKRGQGQSETPEDYLNDYLARKQSRAQMLDQVDKNQQLSVDEDKVSRYLARNNEDIKNLSTSKNPFNQEKPNEKR